MKMPARSILWLLLLAPFAANTTFGQTKPVISAAQKGDNGFLHHTVQSPFQSGVTRITVLLPKRLEKSKRYPALYVLPVEANQGEHWGNGLLELQKSDLHNRLGVICVAPTFSHLPWYADHPTDLTIRQDSYFTKVVVPFVDRTYPVVGRQKGRFLVGFSKSGYGAFSLILRHEDLFSKAVAWDAPIMMDRPNKYGMGPIYGDQQNFEQYKLATLLKTKSRHFGKTQRLALLGYGNFRAHHQRAHALMRQLGIAHEYRDGPFRKHHWSSGWLNEAVLWLFASNAE